MLLLSSAAMSVWYGDDTGSEAEAAAQGTMASRGLYSKNQNKTRGFRFIDEML